MTYFYGTTAKIKVVSPSKELHYNEIISEGLDTDGMFDMQMQSVRHSSYIFPIYQTYKCTSCKKPSKHKKEIVKYSKHKRTALTLLAEVAVRSVKQFHQNFRETENDTLFVYHGLVYISVRAVSMDSLLQKIGNERSAERQKEKCYDCKVYVIARSKSFYFSDNDFAITFD